MPRVPQVNEMLQNEVAKEKVTITKGEIGLAMLGFSSDLLQTIREAGFGLKVDVDEGLEHIQCVLGVPENWKVQKHRFEGEGKDAKRIDEDLGVQELVIDSREHVSQYNESSTSSHAEGVSEIEFQVVHNMDGAVTQYKFTRTD